MSADATPDTRARLSARSLDVWRAVAAAGRRGTTFGQLTDRFKGRYDYSPLKVIVKSLRDCGYLLSKGAARLAIYTINPDRLPIDEPRPAWLDDAADDAADRAGNTTAVRMPAQPMSVFNQGPPPVAGDRPAPAPTVRFNTLFALDSAGRLRIETAGTQVLQLNPDDTRALFRWLDQLTGTGTSRLVDADAA